MSSLAAARADNFYYPPEWSPSKGGLNKFQGQHPLRERAKKIDQGILVVRFEMPFNVNCDGCSRLIGKGVRFNAEKKAIGKYFSTKIWQFKMKCPSCSNAIEIHTDPKNTEYVIKEGAHRKTDTFSAEDAGTIELPDKEDREKLDDPLYRLEHGEGDRKKAESQLPELTRMKGKQDRKHKDDYTANKALRRAMRGQRKEVQQLKAEGARMGLGVALLPHSPEDAAAARQVRFGSIDGKGFERSLQKRRAAIRASSIFPQGHAASGKGRKSSASERTGTTSVPEGSAGTSVLLGKRTKMNFSPSGIVKKRKPESRRDAASVRRSR